MTLVVHALLPIVVVIVATRRQIVGLVDDLQHYIRKHL